MPTQGIWAPRPRAQLLLALFLPFLTRGWGIALAMAKPLNLSQSSAKLCHPRAAAAPGFLAAGGGSAGKRCPEPPQVGREVGRRVEGSCASGVPRDPSARQPPPAGTSRARAACFAAIPVAAASAGAAVASETLYP